MCGIAGFFDKTRDNRNSNLGRILITMLEGLACRGPDSAGVALFGSGADHQKWCLERVKKSTLTILALCIFNNIHCG